MAEESPEDRAFRERLEITDQMYRDVLTGTMQAVSVNYLVKDDSGEPKEWGEQVFFLTPDSVPNPDDAISHLPVGGELIGFRALTTQEIKLRLGNE